MYKILLTGARGFVGKHLHLGLQDEYIVDTFDGDITSLSDIRNIVPEYDIYIHCAAKSSVNNSDHKQMWKVNLEGTENLIKHITERQVTQFQFIFFSSATVYTPTKVPRTEIFPTVPISEYGRTKLEAEKSLRAAHADWGFRLAILRPCAIVGKYMTHGITKDLVDKLPTDNPLLEVLGTKEKQACKQFVHIADVYDAIKFTIENRHKIPGRFTANIFPKDGPITVEEVAREVMYSIEIEKPIAFTQPTWKGDDLYMELRGYFQGRFSSKEAIFWAARGYNSWKYGESI